MHDQLQESSQKPAKQTPIQLFVNHQQSHQKALLDMISQLTAIGFKMDEIANRVAPNSYYKNEPSKNAPETDRTDVYSNLYEHGGMYDALNSVASGSLSVEKSFQVVLDDLRRKIDFFDNLL